MHLIPTSFLITSDDDDSLGAVAEVLEDFGLHTRLASTIAHALDSIPEAELQPTTSVASALLDCDEERVVEMPPRTTLEEVLSPRFDFRGYVETLESAALGSFVPPALHEQVARLTRCALTDAADRTN